MKDAICTPSKIEEGAILMKFWTLAKNKQTDDALSLILANPWILQKRTPKDVADLKEMPFIQAACDLLLPELAAHGIAHGAPLEDRTPDGRTALQHVMLTAYPCLKTYGEAFHNLIEPMIQRGARCDVMNEKGDPVWVKAFSTSLTVFEKLVEGSFALDVITDDGFSGLGLAIIARKFDKIEMLLNKGADVNLFDRKEMQTAPIMIGLANGQMEIVDLLMTHGADLEITDKFKRGFLNSAPTPEAVRWLAEKGVDMEARDGFGRTPLLHILDMLVKTGTQTIKRADMEPLAIAMIQAGADLNAKDDQQTSDCARDIIKDNTKRMPKLNHMLRAFEARQVAMQSLAEMNKPSP